MHVCLQKGENGLVSQASISSLYYRKRVVMRLQLRAWRSMCVLIKTPDVPPGWFDSAGRKSLSGQSINWAMSSNTGGMMAYLISIRPLKPSLVAWLCRLLSERWQRFDGQMSLRSNKSTSLRGFLIFLGRSGSFLQTYSDWDLSAPAKPSGTEKSRQKSEPGSLSRTDSLEMWNRICCLFLLATAVTFYAAARLTGDLHVFFILEDERGYGDLGHPGYLQKGRSASLNRPETIKLLVSSNQTSNQSPGPHSWTGVSPHWDWARPVHAHLHSLCRMEAEGEDAAPRAEEFTLAASRRLASGWPGRRPPSLPCSQSSAGRLRSAARLRKWATWVSPCMRARVREWFDLHGWRVHMRKWGWRMREDEERSGQWPLCSPHLCSCRMTQRPLRGPFLEEATLFFFFCSTSFLSTVLKFTRKQMTQRKSLQKLRLFLSSFQDSWDVQKCS